MALGDEDFQPQPIPSAPQRTDPILSAFDRVIGPPEPVSGGMPKDKILSVFDQLGIGTAAPAQTAQLQSGTPQDASTAATLGTSAFTGAGEFASGLRDAYNAAVRVGSGGPLYDPNTANKPIQMFDPNSPAYQESQRLLQQPWEEGWKDWRWWGNQVAHGVGYALAPVAVTAAGEAVGVGALGAGAVAGGVTGISTLMPKFNQLKATGMSDADALKQAVRDSGIDALTMTAMGMPASKLPFLKNAVGDFLTKGPIREALTNMGIVAPVIGETGSEAKSLLDEGKLRSPEEIIQDYAMNVGVGGMLAIPHLAFGGAREKAPVVPTEEERARYQRMFGGQPIEFASAMTPNAEMKPPDDLGFYSQVRRVVETKGPNSADAATWKGLLSNAPGVKADEMEWLRIPQYLAEASGKISKADLLTHIEDNAIRLEVKELGQKPETKPSWTQLAGREPDEARYSDYSLPGEKKNYREVALNIPYESGSKEELRRAYNRAVDTFANGPYGNNLRLDHPLDANGQPIPGAETRLVNRRTGQEPPPLKEMREGLEKASAKGRFDFPDPKTVTQHFDRNTLAHYRISDRTDRDGKRVRFIEEIQSDWHQKGREVGYKGKPLSAEEEQFLHGIEVRMEDKDNTRGKAIRAKLKGDATHPANDLTWEEGLDHQALNTIRNSRDPEMAMNAAVSRGWLTPEEGKRYVEVRNREKANNLGVADAPFKNNWEELVVKRILRQAADEGMERVAWTSGQQQIERYGRRSNLMPNLSEEQQNGMREFYDKKLPRIVQKWAKTLGMEMGETRLKGDSRFPDSEELIKQYTESNDPHVADDWKRQFYHLLPVRYTELSPAASSRIQTGFPMFSETPGVRVSEPVLSPQEAKGIMPQARKAAYAVVALARHLNIDAPINIRLYHSNEAYLGHMTRDESGYTISLNVPRHATAEEMYATLAHEMGHVTMLEKFDHAPIADKELIMAEWRKWHGEISRANGTTQALLNTRDNAVSNYYNTRGTRDGIPFNSLTPEGQRYLSSFEEWFAEQVARWATTEQRPLTIAERFFKTLGERIASISDWFKRNTGQEYAPAAFMKQWLNSFMTDSPPFAQQMYDTARMRSQKVAQASLARDGFPEVQAVSLQTSSIGAREIVMHSMMGATPPPNAAAHAAEADRFNKVYEHLTSLPQVAEANPHITPLQYYREALGLFNAQIRAAHEEPLAIISEWRSLHGKQAKSVTGLIDDWANMRYLSPQERAQDVRRMPTKTEFQQMVRDNGVSAAGLRVFQRMAKHVDSKLDDVGNVLKQRGSAISDPVKRRAYMDQVDQAIANERRAPYFPFFHDGQYTVEVRGAVGETLHYARARTEKEQQQIISDLKPKLGVGETIHPGFLANDARSLTGIPGRMLDLIGQHLNLSTSQRAALDRLKVEQRPKLGLIYQIRRKNNQVPGYSQDFMRSYANYSLHTARLFARVQWAPNFRNWIGQVRQMKGGVKLDKIANFMQKHFDYVMDPKPDMSALRSFVFSYKLGFSPTTATLYLTQTPLGTDPWLSHHFGDIKSKAAIAKASASFYNYYKRGTLLGTSDPHLRAQREAMRNFVLDGGVAPELAGIAENANFTSNTAKGTATRAWFQYQEAGGTLLHLADTWNRRIAFDAAWHLAMENPNAAYIKRAVQANPMEYQRLVQSGWTTAEAGAYVAGKHTVEQTHFVYQRSHRPQIMQGRASALLMFQFWKQNMAFTLWNYPGVRGRMLLSMALMGGLMGLPFAKDLNGLAKAVGYNLFGKDWDVERAVREFVLDHFGQNNEEYADLLLHGGERNGMGIPAVLDLLGHSVGLPKLPTVDRSQAVGMGDMLPVNVGDMFGPNRDVPSAESRAAQDVLGAAFGMPFDFYKFLADSKLNFNDLKKWEPILPHWMQNLSKAYRWGSEGVERDASGNPVGTGAGQVIRFDATKPTDLAEILARAAGYNPQRLTQAYDMRKDNTEIKAFWEIRRETLMRQAWSARRVNDNEQYDRIVAAIKKFNSDVPLEVSTRISGDQLREYMRRQATASGMKQQGLPALKKDIPLARRVEQMYPVLDEQSRRVQ